MTVDRPWVLTVLPLAVALVWVVARAGRRTVPPRQHRWAVVGRLAAVALLVLAAAGPNLLRSVPTRSVLFLLDHSASISDGGRATADEFVAAALATAPADSRAGVALFGSEVRLDRAVGPARPYDGARTQIEESATDVAGALVAASSLLPSEGSRRVVLVSDGVATTPGTGEAAARLAEAGVAVDIVTLPASTSTDVLVEAVEVPAAALQGDSVPVTAVLRSNRGGTVEVIFEAGEGFESRQTVEVEPGRTEVVAEIPAEAPGYVVVDVSVGATFDTRPENDQASGVFRVLGPARVAVVEGAEDEAAELAMALEAGGLVADVRPGIPSEEEMLAYDGIVLVNVPRPSDDQAADLAAFVEDLGRGLVVVGGDQAFGMGDYHESPLEDVLPVSSNPDDLIRRQPVAEMLVIDTSGSMGACHCRSGEFSEGGIVKTDIAKAGAAGAIAALSDEDSVGVVAVSSGTDLVIPLGPRPSPSEVDEALGPMVANGDTELVRGLEAALSELEGVTGALRHIVLFSDGWDPNEANLLPIARRIADAGITLSVLGTGEGPGVTLGRMAEVGGGRFYPGTDLASIPEIFVEETLMAARGLINEGSFLPTLAAPSPVTEGLEAAPPLLGYVATAAKPTASTALEIGPGDPLLASWQRGLGRATAWTSDATARWSSGWVTWDGYVEHWGAILRQVLPAGRDTPPEVSIGGGEMEIAFDLSELDPDASATARVRRPDGETDVVPLRRTGEASFAATVAAPLPGAYWVGVAVERGDGSGSVASAGAVSGYAEEFAFRPPDQNLMAGIARVTGGRLDPTPAQVLDPAPTRGRAVLPIWPVLAGAALALFLVDVALRRLVLSTSDTGEWREGLASARGRERRRIEAAMAEAETKDRPVPTVSDSETLQRLMRRNRR